MEIIVGGCVSIRNTVLNANGKYFPPADLQNSIEIWPISIVVPPGYRIGLTILGRDYERDGSGVNVDNYKKP